MKKRIKLTRAMLEQIITHVITALKEDGKCPEGGCVKQVGDKWRVISNKTGKLWPAEYDTKKDAEDAIAAYHVQKG